MSSLISGAVHWNRHLLSEVQDECYSTVLLSPTPPNPPLTCPEPFPNTNLVVGFNDTTHPLLDHLHFLSHLAEHPPLGVSRHLAIRKPPPPLSPPSSHSSGRVRFARDCSRMLDCLTPDPTIPTDSHPRNKVHSMDPNVPAAGYLRKLRIQQTQQPTTRSQANVHGEKVRPPNNPESLLSVR